MWGKKFRVKEQKRIYLMAGGMRKSRAEKH